jgi:predicted extracellular nuclease
MNGARNRIGCARKFAWIAAARWLGVGASLTALGCDARPALDAGENVSEAQVALGANASIVISQVYGGGNNSGAPYQNDFVELFNLSNAPASLDNWSIQYTSATGTGTFGSNKTTLGGSVPPGGYYLVKLGAGTTGSGVPLPTPDATGSIQVSSTDGKVALVDQTAGLNCNDATSCSNANALAHIVDLVGFGSANFFEGPAAAPRLGNTTADIRANGGCADTNQNNIDFSAGAPNPRNSATTPVPCGGGNILPFVSSTLPANGASSVAVDTNVTLTFSESVTLTGSWFGIACGTSGSVAAAVSGGPTSYTLDPSANLANAETCTVTVFAAGVTDSSGEHPNSDFAFSFTTVGAGGVVPIHTIQGATHISPLLHAVVTTHGIVTALDSNGYYLQDPVPDANDATSEALFVFTSSAPAVAVGDDVQVTGTVNEFRTGCSSCTPSDDAFSNLTDTELENPTSTSIASHGNALPAPIVLGPAGRMPPTTVIEDDANGDIEATPNVFDPASDGLDFYESLEGMRVELDNAVAVSPTKPFTSGSKEIALLASGGAGMGLRTARGGIVIQAGDFNPERLILGNDVFVGTRPALPDVNVGETFPGAIVGVIGYSFGNFKLFVTGPLPAPAGTGVTQETSSFGPPRAVDLDVAAFNVENLDPSDPPSKFAGLASILVTRLKSPDLVSLEEIQDNDGATDDGVVDATTTLNQLVTAIANAGGPSYQFRTINPVNDQDGGEPGGNIRVVFLFRTDRGLSFVDRSGASSTTANDVVLNGGVPALAFSPGRIDPTNSAFTTSRKPLAGEFQFRGRTFFVIANHWNSKGGDQPLFGRFQPPTLVSEAQRSSQATVVKGFVSKLLTADPNADLVVLGDLNDFEFSPPLLTLKSGGLSDLVETLPGNERYTYVFDGNSQVLDHVLVSSQTSRHVMGFDVVHVNAEFATQASDHDPGVARISFDRTAPVVTGPSGTVTANATNGSGATVSFNVSAQDDVDGSVAVSCSPPSGSTFALGTTPVSCTATDASGNSAQFAFNVKVSSAAPPVPAAPPWMFLLLAGTLALFGVLREPRRTG